MSPRHDSWELPGWSRTKTTCVRDAFLDDHRQERLLDDCRRFSVQPRGFRICPGAGPSCQPPPSGPSPSHRDNDESQRDPTTDDTPHVDLTPVPAHGAPRPSSLRPDPPEGKPILPKLLTSTQVKPRDSNSPGTAFYTPVRSGEVVDRGPFDSAVNIRVRYSGSGSHSQDVAGPIRNVVDVHQPVGNGKLGTSFRPKLYRPLEVTRKQSTMHQGDVVDPDITRYQRVSGRFELQLFNFSVRRVRKGRQTIQTCFGCQYFHHSKTGVRISSQVEVISWRWWKRHRK